MEGYYKVNCVVIPKRAQLAEATEKADKANAMLQKAEAAYAKVKKEVDDLTRQLNKLIDEKTDLEDAVEDCKQKLIRAEKLISGLGGEKTRWKTSSENLVVVFTNLTGDVLISAGMLAYLGAFDSVFRNELSAMWVKKCQERNIPNSGSFSLAQTLGD